MANKVIIVSESGAESWKRDASTWALCICLIVPGALVGIDALTWVGALVFFITILIKSSGVGKTCTIQEARAYLDELEESQ